MRKYQCNIVKTVMFAIIAVMLYCCLTTQNVHAAGTSTKSKAVYTVKKCTDTYKRPDGKAGAKYSYDLVQLKGNSDAVKKINASLKKDYKRTLIDGRDFIYGYAKSRVKTEPLYTITPQVYYYKNRCKVTYNQKGYISILYRVSMCAFSDIDISNYALTFDLKTGKKLNISKVVSGNKSAVKNKITKKFMSKYINHDDAAFVISTMDISDFVFYLKNGKVVVCFNPYDLGDNDWPIKISLNGNYQ